jgi:hypothetical protein
MQYIMQVKGVVNACLWYGGNVFALNQGLHA